MTARAAVERTRPTIGWREWVALPELGAEWIKAKVDTGARSSSLHATDIKTFTRDDDTWIRFSLHPMQRSTADPIVAELPLVEYRSIRSSSGESERRPIVRTDMRLGDRTVAVDLSLTRRDQMGFRLLLGREAIRRRYVVDAGKSFVTGKPPIDVRQANRRKPNRKAR